MSYADIRAVVDAAEAAGLPVPRAEFSWHAVADDVAAEIVRTFPDRRWFAKESSSEWVATRSGRIGLTAFLAPVAARPADAARAKAVLAEASS